MKRRIMEPVQKISAAKKKAIKKAVANAFARRKAAESSEHRGDRK